MKRLTSSLIVLALGAAATLVAAAPAVAAADITVTPSVAQSKIVIDSGNCREVPVTVRYSSSGPIDDFDMDMQVWRGAKNTGTVSFWDYDGDGIDSSYYYFCPYEGLGTFRVGPSDVKWTDADYNTYSRSDSQVAYFTAKQGLRFKSAKIVRKGKVRTFTARALYFDTGINTWTSFPKGYKVRLERRATGGGWQHVKSAKTQKKKGQVSVSTKASKRYEYRLTFAGTDITWGGSSKVIRK